MLWILPTVNVDYIDELFINKGLLKPIPAAKLIGIPVEHLQLWCVTRGVYQPPIEELINWFYKLIKNKKAIEICAGNGSIGRVLGIPSTDSYMQTTPDMISYYKSLGQMPITPPEDVIKLTANEAVNKYKPEVVIGCWVTQLYQDGDIDGSVFGVNEQEIISKVEIYALAGNDSTHGKKRINKIKHETFRFPWLLSRGKDQSLNHIKVWQK